MPTITSSPNRIPSIDPSAVSSCAASDERRRAPRFTTQPFVKLTSLGSTAYLECHARDISEGGLFVDLPAECTLSVGERCELDFTGEVALPKLANLKGVTCYATVVRTRKLSDTPSHRMGAGLRFDRPLYL